MKRLILLCLVAVGCLLPTWSNAQAAPESSVSLIRLHVLANGESLEDQQAKIIVRDELLAYLTPLLEGVLTKEEAMLCLKSNLSELNNVAKQALERLNKPYRASLQLGVFNFPDKHYGTFTLPAGRYQALNVTLGTGEGRNWWCVVFPPLCLTAGVCEPDDEVQAETTFVLRSQLVEWWGSFWSWVARHC